MTARWGIVAVIACLVASAPACASGNGAASSSPSPRPADLRIEIVPGFIANGHLVRYSLRCDPVGGTLPDPAAACERLFSDRGVLSVKSRCFMPDTGSNVVTGTLDGRRVSVRLGNCDPDRGAWQRIVRALGIPAGQTPAG